MFGRLRRAAEGESANQYAILRVYSPEAVAGVLAVGMGTAGVGSGVAIARTADGRQVSALAEAVDGAMSWGRREQRRFLRLPRRVFAVATDEAIVLYEWTFAQGKGRRVATWKSDSYSAKKTKDFGQLEVRIVVGAKVAILSGPRGPHHPAVRATIDAIVRLAATSSPT